MLEMPYCNPPPSGEVEESVLESWVEPTCVSFAVMGEPRRFPILLSIVELFEFCLVFVLSCSEVV